MEKRILLQLFIFLAVFASAQTGAESTGRVTATILTDAASAAEGSTVELLRAKDSALIKTALADKTGSAEFEKVKYGSYLLRISALNFKTFYSSQFDVSNESVSVPTVRLQPKPATDLGNVSVVTQKPFIQRLTDRIVVNVENSIVNAGSTALEVLERSPGITVDQNDNIALRGRAGVIIMIDGKITPMSGADLSNYLKGLSSNAIERIDIITNPSSRYDAAGNSGIIDIRLKKDKRLGSNGILNAGYGQGVYPKANAGLSMNYRNKSVNVFGNYNYNFRKGMNHLFLERNFYENGQFTGGDEKDNLMVFPTNNHAARLGADFFPAKNTIVGFVVNSTFSSTDRTNTNSAIVMNDQKIRTNTFNTNGTGDDRFKNTVANVNLKQTFKPGHELTADADYGVFNNTSITTSRTNYYSLSGTTIKPAYQLNGDQSGKLTIKTGKIDYTNTLKKAGKFELGAKTSFVSSDNDAKFFNVSTGTPVNDTTKTNRFYYDENNNAGYINYSQEFKKFSLQLGLRGEQTKIKTRQVRNNITWDSSYFQLFPSAFFNYKLKEDQTLGVSVSRRIDRPNYNQLNPFLFLIDVTTYSTGAPGLLPQFTWSYELSYTHKQLNFTLGYSKTNDVQTTVILPFKTAFPNIPVTDSNITIQVPVNLASSEYYGLSISAPVRINKWWNMMNNGDLFYQKYNGNLAGTPLSNGTPSAQLRTNNTFTIKNGWTAELNANYNTKSRYGYMVMEPQWGLAAGVQKTILKNKGTIRFNVTDIFWTSLPKATITYNNYVENWHAQRESRVANLSFTYRFGNNKVAAARRRATASEEERRRAGGQ